MENQNGIKKGWSQYVVLIVYLICGFLHFFMLDKIVSPANIDEVALGCSAYAIGNYGTDRYGNSFPIYFQNFFSGQSAAYSYLTAIFVKLFGLNLFSVRFSNALFYTIAATFVKKMADEIFNDNRLSIATLVIYTISPVLVTMGRSGLDCNFMNPVTTIALYSIIRAINTRKTSDYIIAAVIHGISFYTYALSYIMIPLYLILLCVFLIRSKQITVKQTIISSGVLLILGMPIAAQLYTNIFLDEAWNIGPFTFIKMIDSRMSEININSFFPNLINTFIAWLLNDGLIYSSEHFTNYYIFSVPFILIGMVHSFCVAINDIKTNKVSGETVILFFTISCFIGLGFISGIRTYRLNALFTPGVFYVVVGIRCILNMFNKYKKLFSIILLSLYVISFIDFMVYYFITDEYDKEFTSEYWYGTQPFTEEIEFIENDPKLKNKEVYVMGMDACYLYTIFSHGEFQLDEIKKYEDRFGYAFDARYTYNDYHMEFPLKYDESAVYIINNRNQCRQYKNDVMEQVKNKMQSKEFPYYTIYWNNN